jgi:hypothetical protein
VRKRYVVGLQVSETYEDLNTMEYLANFRAFFGCTSLDSVHNLKYLYFASGNITVKAMVASMQT